LFGLAVRLDNGFFDELVEPTLSERAAALGGLVRFARLCIIK
jgi:hypothetical protein